jgi:hypothetical protein
MSQLKSLISCTDPKLIPIDKSMLPDQSGYVLFYEEHENDLLPVFEDSEIREFWRSAEDEHHHRIHITLGANQHPLELELNELEAIPFILEFQGVSYHLYNGVSYSKEYKVIWFDYSPIVKVKRYWSPSLAGLTPEFFPVYIEQSGEYLGQPTASLKWDGMQHFG